MISDFCNYILQSNLLSKIEPGLNALDQDDLPEIQERFNQTQILIQKVRQNM